jgi:ubiquinone/menaquinone biosynthesis C-methylase UbiE
MREKFIDKKSKNTSWEKVSGWYDSLVKEKGHYYHEHVIFPNLLRLLDIDPKSPKSLLDLACGPGVLSKILPSTWEYCGIDLSPSFIKSAKSSFSSPKATFFISDVTKPLPLTKNDFDYVALILSLQNIEQTNLVLENCFLHLKKEGKLLLVLNHPSFRIPKQSSWEVDRSQNRQYRCVHSYLSSLDIPLQAHPSKGSDSEEVYAFHRPLSYYSHLLEKNKFLIQRIEEWISDKKSEGGCAQMEDRARKEFPLFMTIVAVKK